MLLADIQVGAEGSPAYAGIDPGRSASSWQAVWFPRLRGDRPFKVGTAKSCASVPPPTRG